MKPLLVGQAPARGGKLLKDTPSGRHLRRLAPELDYDHVNLFKAYPGKAGKGDRWNAKLARRRADDLARKMFDGRSVILLGDNVTRAFGFNIEPLTWYPWTISLSKDGHKRCRIAMLPHPSGVNRWWNDADNALAAEMFLRGTT